MPEQNNRQPISLVEAFATGATVTILAIGLGYLVLDAISVVIRNPEASTGIGMIIAGVALANAHKFE